MEGQGSMERLPEDVFVAILGRLPPHGLAVARCVCKAWHATIDARQPLHLFPPSLAGLFINFFDLPFSEFFFRPPRRDDATAAIIGKLLDYVPSTDDEGDTAVMDHCNGLLLLCNNYVANPATRRWAALPPMPPGFYQAVGGRDVDYIVFDPAVSPHYQVVIVPSVPRSDESRLEIEWPPSPCIMHIFSSATWSWEKRSFARRGDAIGTVAHLQPVDRLTQKVLSAYWRGQLYVLTEFVMRISLSSCTYQAIQPPIDMVKTRYEENVCLGRSENGVYFASFDRQCRLRVWILNELHGGGSEWLLQHDNNLQHMLSRGVYNPQVRGPWTMDNNNYKIDNCTPPVDINQLVEDKLDWDSDDDNTPDTRERGWHHHTGRTSILGFHPFKEVIFLNEYIHRGLAYHIGSSKLEDMGNIYPKDYDCTYNRFIDQSFPYTPCWIGDLPGSIQSKHSQQVPMKAIATP